MVIRKKYVAWSKPIPYRVWLIFVPCVIITGAALAQLPGIFGAVAWWVTVVLGAFVIADGAHMRALVAQYLVKRMIFCHPHYKLEFSEQETVVDYTFENGKHFIVEWAADCTCHYFHCASPEDDIILEMMPDVERL